MNLEGFFGGKTIDTNGISPHVNTTKKDPVFASLTSLISTKVLRKQARGIERQQKNTYPNEEKEIFFFFLKKVVAKLQH
ncbi:hypothetical protein IMY05_019G0113000 [Salix suchowensis]|nr:hypothetical protein IMY05_019G0113000 [Salix suchowensis]